MWIFQVRQSFSPNDVEKNGEFGTKLHKRQKTKKTHHQLLLSDCRLLQKPIWNRITDRGQETQKIRYGMLDPIDDIVARRLDIAILKYDSVVVPGYNIVPSRSDSVVGPSYDIWEMLKLLVLVNKFVF